MNHPLSTILKSPADADALIFESRTLRKMPAIAAYWESRGSEYQAEVAKARRRRQAEAEKAKNAARRLARRKRLEEKRQRRAERKRA